MPGEDFEQHLQQCENHSLLTLRQILDAKKAIFSYVHTAGMALQQHYPDTDFILQHCAFLDVSRHKFIPCDIGKTVDKFSNDYVNQSMRVGQYSTFINDSTLDFVFECMCKKDKAMFEGEEYSKLPNLALLLQSKSTSPDNVACERGYSCMNFIKNEYWSRWISENLNALIVLAQENQSVDDIPYKPVVGARCGA